MITGADVNEIVVKNGCAMGVRLANGDTIEGRKFVASAIDAPTTMRMAGEELPSYAPKGWPRPRP